MSSSEESSPSSSAVLAREVDPLLKDLSEKKQTFRRNVVSLAAEIKEVRSRLVSQQQSLAKEALIRQEAESKAKNMEMEISRLEKALEERNLELKASASASEKYVKELNDLRLQLLTTRETADENAHSAQFAQLQCSALVKELEEKNYSIKEQEDRVSKLGRQLDRLQKDLQAREFSQRQLKDEVTRIEDEIMLALTKAGTNSHCELRKILDEVSPKNFEKMNKLLMVKDEEIAKLRDDIRVMSAQWKAKIEELESQLEKHHRVDQEMKKKVLKLEFCLQEARSQTRKLQRMGERRDKALKELRDQLATKQLAGIPAGGSEKKNIWDTSGFRIAVSMSMLIMLLVSKR